MRTDETCSLLIISRVKYICYDFPPESVQRGQNCSPLAFKNFEIDLQKVFKKAYYRFEILTIATRLIGSPVRVRARGGNLPIGYFLTHSLPGYIE